MTEFSEFKLVTFPQTETCSVIVLDAIEPGFEPEYCIHGKATCMNCGDWLWLGHATHDLVMQELALPMCHACADKLIPKDMEPKHIHDHLREDGPHE
jgi:hypothetical protein